jgi:hypothetical protein
MHSNLSRDIFYSLAAETSQKAEFGPVGVVLFLSFEIEKNRYGKGLSSIS